MNWLNKFKFQSIHLQALIVWLIYSAIGKFMFVRGVVISESKWAIEGVFIYAVIFSLIFLYLFEHQDFFKFASEIESKEQKKEKRLTDWFLHWGKLVTVLGVGTIAGPVAISLGVRLFYRRRWYRFLLAVVIAIAHAFLWLTLVGQLFP